jgi:hypothetical protein
MLFCKNFIKVIAYASTPGTMDLAEGMHNVENSSVIYWLVLCEDTLAKHTPAKEPDILGMQ